jgi:hypothetical protein
MTAARAALTLLVALALLLRPAPVRAGGPPDWLPHYDLSMDLDVAGHQARCVLHATWTNATPRPTSDLVFNAHSHYIVPDGDIGLMAKTLEILRVQAGEALGQKEPSLDIQTVRLLAPAVADLSFQYAGDTKTALVVHLPESVRPGESATVEIVFLFHLPQKQGRWGQWHGVTYLSNWLPVFAVYDPAAPPKPTPDGQPLLYDPCWQPTPFIPWHQPFYNEAGNYHVRVALPCKEQVACSGSVVAARELPGGRKEIDIDAPAMRDFAFLCSALYQPYEGHTPPEPGVPPVKVRVLALPGHEFYAKEMVRIAAAAIARYSQWFGPYPWPEFTIAESFFGWNGNECSTLVMIDERVFSMPHLACSYVEYLVSHETCHQWWYNMVGTNGYCETWMDEALATFFSHRLMDEKFGKNNAMMNYPNGLGWLPNIRREDYRIYSMYGCIGRGENCPAVQEMDKFGHVVNLFSMCYDKGARIVGMIEDRLGPVAFRDFMRVVFQKYQFRILRVADFQRELEAYTGHSWDQFFKDWLYGKGLSDWAVESVEVQAPPSVQRHCWECPHKHKTAQGETWHVVVTLRQKAEYTEPTSVGIALPGCKGYPIRVPVLPAAETYDLDDPPGRFQALGDNRYRLDLDLPDEPEQVTVDPDQVLVDRDPSNNFWKPPFRWRVTPLYTFLEETDLTNAYDRWNLIFGPWIYGTVYSDPWYPRSTMVGVRAGAYRTQEFSGGAYAAYRTDFRDVVAGVDALWDHWPGSHFQVGFNAEQRLTSFMDAQQNAFRGVVFGRYIFQYGSSLYLPPMHYVELFSDYQDNFLPYARSSVEFGERPQREATAGIHYRLDYLTPYWDPEGGFRLDLSYQGGWAELAKSQGMQAAWGQFSIVKGLPDLSEAVGGAPLLEPALRYLGDTRLALRMYGAMALPTRGEFFTMGGGDLFRGFDQAQRQGSAVWVGSVEWRLPLARGLALDVCDHVLGLRNLYGAAFYDVGDAYTLNHSVGPVAHAVGGGLRFDVAWFGFVERTMLRVDVARAIDAGTPWQVWFGVQHPF